MDKDMIISYLTLRKAIGILGISLPFICMLFAGVELSMSAYFHTRAISIFVGTLFVTGAFLLSYKGYDVLDNIASAIAGVSAIMIAIFPSGGKYGPWHDTFAAIFFLSLALISFFLFTKGNVIRLSPNKKKRNIIYRVCGLLILIIILSYPLTMLLGIYYMLYHNYFILVTETLMLIAFGVSWLVKGEAILKDK